MSTILASSQGDHLRSRVAADMSVWSCERVVTRSRVLLTARLYGHTVRQEGRKEEHVEGDARSYAGSLSGSLYVVEYAKPSDIGLEGRDRGDGRPHAYA